LPVAKAEEVWFLSAVTKISGCTPRYSPRLVVPAFIAPITRNVGSTRRTYRSWYTYRLAGWGSSSNVHTRCNAA